mgnify:FL=1|jgi:hypothetical protein
MTNAWSFLFDELNMSNQNYWEDDGFSVVGNPSTESSDTIVFNSSHLSGGIGEDHINFVDPSIAYTTEVPDSSTNLSTPNGRRKYSEDEIIKELQEYIGRTYDQHYSAGSDKIQTLDLIEACGDGEAFCRSNILKYASRYDKKGTARRDIMKILHYAVLLMHFNDKNAQRETYPQ